MVEYVFAPGSDNEIRLGDADIVQHNPVKIHTGKGDLRATVALDRRLDDAAKRQDRLDVRIDGEVKWTGFVVGVRHDVGGATTRIRADGIGKRLEETRPAPQRIDIKSKRLDEAIRDYWTRTPFDATVRDQIPEVVAEDELVQSAATTSEFQAITDLDPTDPVVIENGELRRGQSAYFFEGESEFISGSFTDPEYSDGGATGFDTGISNTGDKATYTVTPEYTIPEENAKLKFRLDFIDGDNDNDIKPPEIAVRLNGDTLFQNQFLASFVTGVQWDDFNTDGNYSGGDLTAGSSVDIEIEVTNGTIGDPDDRINVDAVVLYDDRFSYTFDNSVDSNGYLSGPALFPSFEPVTLDASKTGFNIGRLEAALLITDTSGGQAIDLSNDGGNTFTTAGTNTDAAAVDFSTGGRRAAARLTLGGFGSRTTASPTEDFTPQAVSGLQLRADLDDLTIIDELTLRGNNFDNLQKLHDYGDFIYVIEHADYGSESDLVVESFGRGQETRPAPAAFDSPAALQPEVAAETYFNSVFVRGRERADGTIPSAEVTNDDAVAEDGRKISPGVLRDLSIGTDAGAQFRANALLAKALAEDDLVGTLRGPPELTDPGYARPVDFGDGPSPKTVERVTLSETGDSVESTFEFSVRPRLARRVEELRRKQRDVEDQL